MKATEIMERLFQLSFDREASRVCDSCKAGDPEKEVKKVGLTMFPTPDVIKQASEWGADLLIVHEPIFYDHLDRVTDEVQRQQKVKLIEESGMTLFRYHDHPHFREEDFIAKGMVKQMNFGGKADYVTPGAAVRITLESPMTAVEVAKQIEKNCNIKHVRICGARDIPSTKISGMFGAPGTELEELEKEESQIVIVGETCEWTATEYARDAAQFGRNKALLILGHATSEEGGMMYVTSVLCDLCPELSVKYFPSGEVYTYTDSE